MSSVKYNQEPLFPVFSNLFENFFGKDIFEVANKVATGFSTPSVNVKENKDDYKVEVAAPGLSKEDFKVEVENNLLKISSKKESTQETQEEGKYTRREFSYQSFERSFALPNTANVEQIVANYTDGILNIHIPKKETSKEKPSKTIHIG
jgi:HSP20 family protein